MSPEKLCARHKNELARRRAMVTHMDDDEVGQLVECWHRWCGDCLHRAPVVKPWTPRDWEQP